MKRNGTKRKETNRNETERNETKRKHRTRTQKKGKTQTKLKKYYRNAQREKNRNVGALQEDPLLVTPETVEEAKVGSESRE